MSVLAVPAQPVYATQALNLLLGFKLQGLTVLPKAFAKSVVEFETFVSIGLRPEFADVVERPAVHNWKSATRVERTLGFEPRLASLIKNRWPAVTSRAATAVV
jgi:hypothetical protein